MHQHLIFFQSHRPSVILNTHKVCQRQTLKHVQLWNKHGILLLSETRNDSKVQQSEYLEALASGQMDNTLTEKETQTVTSHRSREKWWLLQVLISPSTSIAAANGSRFDRMVGQKGKDEPRLTFLQELVKFAALSRWISIRSHTEIKSLSKEILTQQNSDTVKSTYT